MALLFYGPLTHRILGAGLRIVGAAFNQLIPIDLVAHRIDRADPAPQIHGLPYPRILWAPYHKIEGIRSRF
jgi:hypothetical protein